MPAWHDLMDCARDKGWQHEITPNGCVRFSKDGTVVFGPHAGAPPETIAECVARLEYVQAPHGLVPGADRGQ
jgi:hypothetical protein